MSVTRENVTFFFTRYGVGWVESGRSAPVQRITTTYLHDSSIGGHHDFLYVVLIFAQNWQIVWVIICPSQQIPIVWTWRVQLLHCYSNNNAVEMSMDRSGRTATFSHQLLPNTRSKYTHIAG